MLLDPMYSGFYAAASDDDDIVEIFVGKVVAVVNEMHGMY